MNAAVVPQRTLPSFHNDYRSQAFVIQQLIGRVITIVPARVVAVSRAGSLAASAYVDVQPLLKQRTGAGKGVPHGVVTGCPSFRLQAGTAAVVVDPAVGDVGLLLVAYRDTSELKALDRAIPGTLQGGDETVNVGSAAQYDWGSAFYLGGFFGGTVSQYVQLTESLIKVLAPSINLNGVTIDSSGNLAAHTVDPANGFTGTIAIQNSTTTLQVLNGIITGHT